MNQFPSFQAWALAGAALLAAASQAVAEPAQSPLTTRSASPPLPNLMITLDDSGSMLFDFMPEESYKVNGYSVKLATSVEATRVWPVGYPGDPRRSVSRNGNNYTYTLGGVVTGLGSGGASVYEMQFRSPDVNATYYNPDTLYKPWKDANNLPNDMSPSNYKAARFDPTALSSKTLDLSSTAKSTQNWCVGFNNCPSAKLSFNPALVYRLTSGSDPTKAASYTLYDLNDSSKYAAKNSHPNRTDCDPSGKGGQCTQTQEQQNFANWFTYYRLRETLTKAAIGRALVDFQDKIRAGWAQYNYADNGVVTKKTRVQRGVQQMDAAQLKQLLLDIYGISSFSGTPSREVLDSVGAYFKVTDESSPWLGVPGDSGSGRLTCRRSANFLLTDGYYNDTYSLAGDQDNTNGPTYSGTNNPDGYSPDHYIAELPFSDGKNKYSNTLSDVAIQYYKNDLQTGIDNKVAPVEGDIAFWQHLSQYMVGLGVSGTLKSATPADKSDTLTKIKNGTLVWPDPGPAANSAEKIDDMWHAAVATGGDFYSVKNSTELTEAMKDAIGKTVSRTAKEAGVSLNSSEKIQGTYKFVPKYQAVSWYGDLEAFVLDQNGAVTGDAAWKASQPAGGLMTWSSRNLLVWNPDKTKATPFTWPTGGDTGTDGMGSTNAKALVSVVGTNGATLTDWVRGDTSNEAADKAYRTRSGNRFPDFVNSPPVYVKDLLSLNYAGIESGYTAYLASKSNRSKGVVFLGGNGGMLHAFDSSNGVELMGFLPSPGLPKLAKIAAKDYGTDSNFHQYVVDGPHIESDAFITTRRDATAKWANVVVGTMGAGGRAVYALHVPTASPTALDADTVLWQRSSSDDADFGYMMGDVAVGKIQGGSASDGWKVFVGNGIDSGSGKAVLMVIDLSLGTVGKVVLDAGGGNGAMGVSLVKNDKGEVEAAYVGDMKGKLWRVEFGSATDSASWKVGYKGAPLLQALDPDGATPQSITTAPYSLPFKYGTGRLVVFGTGRLLNDADADSIRQQTIFGVRDPSPTSTSTDTVDSPYYGTSDLRSLLAKRTLGPSQIVKVAGVNRTFYPILGDEMDWETGTGKKGWYLDLPNAGQRVIYPVQGIFDDYVLVQSMVPAAKAAQCEISNGSGMNFIFRAHEGLPPKEAIVDTNNDGKIDDSDDPLGAYDVSADGTDGLVVPPDSECVDGFKIVWDFDTDPNGKAIRLACGNTPLKIKDRVWREIVNPPQPN